ncbi:MAG: uroporphyrinogen-III synthase [Calditrichaeota bacterium]|nr:uroporphyrinogen-III synthase [Calditrichota bacterium]MCB9369839.1 uroporphyrinogen-III synthase [Calditrichota bacterium]
MPGRVLILRDKALCAELIRELDANGVDCTFLPVTNTEFLAADVKQLFKYNWIAFTSANGVRGLFRALKTSAHVLPLNIKIAAVGKATAEVIHELFSRSADVVSEIADGTHLAQTLSKSLPAGTEILYPSPAGHDTEFTKIARQEGLHIDCLPVYKTVPVEDTVLREQLESAAGFAAAVFYAPSAVRAFGKAFPAPWNLTAIAIGPSTQKALAETGHKNISMSQDTYSLAISRAVREALELEWGHTHA